MVYMLIGNGFEEIEAIAPADILRRAGVEMRMLGIGGKTVRGGHGIEITADEELGAGHAGKDFELLVIPGGGGGVASIKGSAEAVSLVKSAYERGIYIGAICAGPTVLGELGYLRGVRAICFPGCEERMGGAKIQKDTFVVHDGKIITARAAGSAIDFGLKLVEVLRSWEAAEKVRTEIFYEYNERALS